MALKTSSGESRHINVSCSEDDAGGHRKPMILVPDEMSRTIAESVE